MQTYACSTRPCVRTSMYSTVLVHNGQIHKVQQLHNKTKFTIECTHKTQRYTAHNIQHTTYNIQLTDFFLDVP